MAYASVYPILIVCGWIGQDEIGKPKKSVMRFVKEGFQFFRAKLDRDDEGDKGRYMDRVL